MSETASGGCWKQQLGSDSPSYNSETSQPPLTKQTTKTGPKDELAYKKVQNLDNCDQAMPSPESSKRLFFLKSIYIYWHTFFIFKTVTFFPLLATPLLWSIFFKELRLGMCSSRFCFFWHLRLKWKESFPNKNIPTFQILSCGCEILMQYFRYFRSMKSVLVNVQTSKQWHVPSRPGRTKLTQLFFPDWQQCKLANQPTNRPVESWRKTNLVHRLSTQASSSKVCWKMILDEKYNLVSSSSFIGHMVCCSQ